MSDEDHDIGVGPHPDPWPDDPRLDPELLAAGDRRNVVDRYRYWRVDAIVADLDPRRHPFHVAIENWRHDRNIGTVVRTANAFLADAVHIVGRRRWNRRGAMVTDAYQHLHHHATIAELVSWADSADLPIVAIDNLPGAVALETTALPRRCVLLFGQEGPGLSAEARAACVDGVLDRPVRLDPVDQRGRRCGDRHARLDPDPRRALSLDPPRPLVPDTGPAVPGTPHPVTHVQAPAPLGPLRPRSPFAPEPVPDTDPPCLAPPTRLRMYKPRSARAAQATEALRTRTRA